MSFPSIVPHSLQPAIRVFRLESKLTLTDDQVGWLGLLVGSGRWRCREKTLCVRHTSVSYVYVSPLSVSCCVLFYSRSAIMTHNVWGRQTWCGSGEPSLTLYLEIFVFKRRFKAVGKVNTGCSPGGGLTTWDMSTKLRDANYPKVDIWGLTSGREEQLSVD